MKTVLFDTVYLKLHSPAPFEEIYDGLYIKSTSHQRHTKPS